jgi:hypothetical protein
MDDPNQELIALSYKALEELVDNFPPPKMGYGPVWEHITFPEGWEKPPKEEFEAKLQELIDAQPWKELREERNKRIAETDALLSVDYPHALESRKALEVYRQALRDLPANTENPTAPVWPAKPELSTTSAGAVPLFLDGNINLGGALVQYSDDRLKENEEHVEDAKTTLLKLKPQVYDKGGVRESGLIAQDVYYDAPELKHLLTLPQDARPPVQKPVHSEDIQEDPDYSAWGGEPTRLNYIGLIPYLVKSTQELNAELVAERAKVATLEKRVHTKGRRLAIPYDEVDEKAGLIVTVAGELSDVACDRGFLGVVERTQPEDKETHSFVTTTGETRVWVTDEGVSEIRVGDLVVTSNVSGYAKVQDDDLHRAHTVGRVLEFCDFEPENVHVKKLLTERANVTTYHALAEVHVGEYSNLASEDRLAVDEVYYLRTTQQQVALGEPHDLAKWFKTQSIAIDAGTYAALPEDERVNYDLDDATGQYVYTQEITVTQDVYNDLSAAEKSTYAYGYFRYVYDESPVPKLRYEERTRSRYYRVVATSPVALPNYHEHTREEDVPVLDAHGQYQYVDTEEVEPEYQTRYILADGSLTTRHNLTHNAALLRVQLLA